MATRNGESNRRILVIDDTRAIHDDFRKVLCDDAANDRLDDLSQALFGNEPSSTALRLQFELESAYQGQEGLAKLIAARDEGRPFALAFVDMRMPPGWDGLETIKHLWQEDPDLQVVICTAYTDYAWSEVVQQLGNSDQWLVLKKPFDNVEVCQLASALVEKRRLSAQLRSKMHDLERLVDLRTAALREREDRIQAIVDTAPDGIITCDDEGVVRTFNLAAASLFGYDPQGVIGRHVSTLLAAKQQPPDPNVRRQFDFAPTEKTASRELDSVRQDGTVFPARWTVGGVSTGSLQLYTAIVRDQTADKQLQCELAQAHKLESVGQLAAGIAHEINTPTQYVGDNVHFLRGAFGDLMTALQALEKLLAELEQRGLASESAAECRRIMDQSEVSYLAAEIPTTIDQTLDGIQRIASIVRAMKEFSHPGNTEKTCIDLHAALQTTITVARNEWKYVADMETDFAADLPPVPCLAGELNQVFLNLIINAAHAIGDANAGESGRKGTITVRTRRSSAWAEILISDTGTGIPEEIRSRIFDPFFTTKEVGKGTGQGLAIARSVVVDKHGGHIDVQTEPGQGTTFRVRVPLEHPALNSSIEESGVIEDETRLVCR
jgi:two-component system, NtrC family, sensor kinase